MDCQYVATQRGGVALVFEGHRYNKVRDGKDGTVYWRCSRDRQCPGRAVTVHSRIKKANNKHNHSPDNGVKSGQTIISSSQIGQLSQLGAAVGQNAMAQSLQGLNCNANSVAAMAAILGQGPGNNVTAAAVAALLQQHSNNSAANGSKHSNSNHTNGLLNSSLLALGGSAHASLSQHSQHSSSSASSSPFQLDSSENGTFNFPSLKQLNQINQMNGTTNSSLAAFNAATSNGQSSVPSSPLDSMLGLSSQNDFSVLQQLQNNLQNSHRSQQALLLNNHTTHRSSSATNHSTINNNNNHSQTTNSSQSRENSSRDNSSNNSCNNSNNSSLSGKTLNGLHGKQQALLDAQTNAQLINELKLNSLMSLNSLVKNAVANQGNCNLNNLSNSLQNLNSLTGLTNLSNNLSSLNSLNSLNNNKSSNQHGAADTQQNHNQNSISNGENGDATANKHNTSNELSQNGANGLLNSSTASQLNSLLLQMEQMSQLANNSFKEQANPTNSTPQSNGSPILNGNDQNQNSSSSSTDTTMQTLSQLNNLLNSNLSASNLTASNLATNNLTGTGNSLNNKLQSMLAFPSLVNETLKYFSTTNSSMASALTNQMIGQFGTPTQNSSTVGLNEDDNQLMTG